MIATTFILLKNYKEIYRSENEDEVYKKLKEVQPHSMTFATTHGDFNIIWWKDDFKPVGASLESRTIINNFGDTSHDHSDAEIFSIDAPADSELEKITNIKCGCGFDALDELRLKQISRDDLDLI
jgi:hypothetical protein